MSSPFLNEMQALVDHAELDDGLVLVSPRAMQLLVDLASAGAELAALKVRFSMDMTGVLLEYRLIKLRRAQRAIEKAQIEANEAKSVSARS